MKSSFLAEIFKPFCMFLKCSETLSRKSKVLLISTNDLNFGQKSLVYRTFGFANFTLLQSAVLLCSSGDRAILLPPLRLVTAAPGAAQVVVG